MATKTINKAPASLEQHNDLDVSLRIRMYGKPDRVRADVKARLERELGLAFGDVEVRRVATARRVGARVKSAA